MELHAGLWVSPQTTLASPQTPLEQLTALPSPLADGERATPDITDRDPSDLVLRPFRPSSSMPFCSPNTSIALFPHNAEGVYTTLNIGLL